MKITITFEWHCCITKAWHTFMKKNIITSWNLDSNDMLFICWMHCVAVLHFSTLRYVHIFSCRLAGTNADPSAAPVFEMIYERNPVRCKFERRLEVNTSPLNIIYNPQAIKKVTEFFYKGRVHPSGESVSDIFRPWLLAKMFWTGIIFMYSMLCSQTPHLFTVIYLTINS